MTPPEQDDSESVSVSDSMSLSALSGALDSVPINPTNVKMFEVTLPPEIRPCSSSLLNNHMIAVGRSDSIVTVMDAWRSESECHLVNLVGHSAEVWATSFSGDSNRLLSGSRDRSIRLWNLEKYESEGVIESKCIYKGSGLEIISRGEYHGKCSIIYLC